jgi:hypothetical protein
VCAENTWAWSWHRSPGAVIAPAPDAGIDEGDPGAPILHVGILGAIAGKRLAGFPLAYVGFEATMQARERIVKTFRMP